MSESNENAAKSESVKLSDFIVGTAGKATKALSEHVARSVGFILGNATETGQVLVKGVKMIEAAKVQKTADGFISTDENVGKDDRIAGLIYADGPNQLAFGYFYGSADAMKAAGSFVRTYAASTPGDYTPTLSASFVFKPSKASGGSPATLAATVSSLPGASLVATTKKGRAKGLKIGRMF